MFWDTCGQEKFCALTPSLFKGVSLICIVYAINDKKTFNNISKWVNIAKTACSEPDIIVFLIGNKRDLENERAVTEEEANEIKTKYNFNYFIEVSAKSGFNITQLVEKMGTAVYDKYSTKEKILNETVKIKREDLTRNSELENKENGKNNKNKKRNCC